jgi:hypothetical protein
MVSKFATYEFQKNCYLCTSSPNNHASMFFDCYFPKFHWRAIYFVLGIPPPQNSEHMLSTWCNGG